MKDKNETIDRVALAEQLFVQGYNCSQAVVAAFADLYGYTREQAPCGSTDASDRDGKSNNYKVVQDLCNEFKQQYGSLICADLLKIKRDAPLTHIASPRTEEYYKTRPCVAQVVTAARIFDQWRKQNQS